MSKITCYYLCGIASQIICPVEKKITCCFTNRTHIQKHVQHQDIELAVTFACLFFATPYTIQSLLPMQ